MTKNIIIQIDDYKKILNNNKKHFDNLSTICKQIGERVEGNCFTEHLNIDHIMKELIYKQLNHFSLGMNATNIMEIGFNAGHSSLLYLLSNPNSKLTIFDICSHAYTIPCYKYLQEMFPHRLQIYPGDSTKTVPSFIINNPNTKFDLIHIDGCHHLDIASQDFYNSLKLASDIIIWDDTHMKHLDNLLNEYIKKGTVERNYNSVISFRDCYSGERSSFFLKNINTIFDNKRKKKILLVGPRNEGEIFNFMAKYINN